MRTSKSVNLQSYGNYMALAPPPEDLFVYVGFFYEKAATGLWGEWFKSHHFDSGHSKPGWYGEPHMEGELPDGIPQTCPTGWV
jgi:hypothetical protein